MLGHCCTLPKFKQATHVIFDLDGTIIDSENVYAAALQKAVQFFGKTWRPECQTKIAGSVMETTARITVELHGLECTSEEFCDKFNEIAVQDLHNLELMPGAERLIRHFHTNKVPLAIATSSKEDSFKMKTKPHRELIDLFDHVVCGGSDPMVKNGKPAPDIFLICASRFPENPKPEKCLVFEDSYNGVQGALAAGMQVVMIPDLSVPYDMWKGATLRIDSLNYIIPQLFQLPAFPPDDQVFSIEASKKDQNEESNVKEKKNETENVVDSSDKNVTNSQPEKVEITKDTENVVNNTDISIKENAETFNQIEEVNDDNQNQKLNDDTNENGST